MPAANTPEASEREPRRDPVRLKVFISYSRRDVRFVDQLVKALGALGFITFIDLEDIGVEPWDRRIDQLILESDAMVFVLTPASAKSEMCAEEVEQALALNKLIVPVVAKRLGETKPDEKLPALELINHRRINYIYFYEESAVPGSGFGSGLAQLNTALSMDVQWTREHTRVSGLAARWASDPSEDRLVRRSELDYWKKWRDTHPPNAPEITQDQRAFLQASEEAERKRDSAERKQLEERQRAVQQVADAQKERAAALDTLAKRTRRGVIWLLTLLVILVGAAVILYWQAQNLERADLRLRKDLNLRIADTDRVVEASVQWYQIVTDYKLAIGAYFSLKDRDIQTGSGFLAHGGDLREEWKNQVVFLTASHVIPRQKSGKPDFSQGYLVFPGADKELRVRFEDVLFEPENPDLDVAVLRLSALPRHTVPVQLADRIEAQEKLGAIAVLYWTSKSFWVGFGHGVPRSNGAEAQADRMYYTYVTEPGASGAPVFDAMTGNVVCLHRAKVSEKVGECTSMAKIVAAIRGADARQIKR